MDLVSGHGEDALGLDKGIFSNLNDSDFLNDGIMDPTILMGHIQLGIFCVSAI